MLFTDQGVEAVKRFIYQVMIQRLKRVNFLKSLTKTPPARTVTGSRRCGIQYQSELEKSGPAHAKEFKVEVFVNGQTMGHGHGRSKKLETGSSPHVVENEEWWTMYPKEIETKALNPFADKTKVMLTKGSLPL